MWCKLIFLDYFFLIGDINTTLSATCLSKKRQYVNIYNSFLMCAHVLIANQLARTVVVVYARTVLYCISREEGFNSWPWLSRL